MTAFINYTLSVRTLINDNCESYDLIMNKIARRLRLERVVITSRDLAEFDGKVSEEITEMTRIPLLNVGGYMIKNIFVYVIL